jgi:hypothetical protein
MSDTTHFLTWMGFIAVCILPGGSWLGRLIAHHFAFSRLWLTGVFNTALALILWPFAILQRTDQPEHLCTAGLFHSVYGTKAFRPVTFDKGRRAEVAQLIGTNAEALVFAFCELPRPRLFEAGLQRQQIPEQIAAYVPTHTHEGAPATTHRIQQFYAELLALECANLIEQRTLHPFPHLARYAQEIGMLDAQGFCL